LIEAHGLKKFFTDKKRGIVKAVDGISFSSKPGEIFGVLGPNGAGKTTLLRMLATILEPTEGTATVAGFDIRTQSQEVRSRIGYLSGSTALYERLTAREMVTYFAELNGLSRDETAKRIEEIFTELQMHEFADARCDKLSTGQKQRVSIARTIIHRPPVLFFDEPTSGLDIITARTIIKFIRRCRDEGRTVIFSTHISSEILVCDRLIVVNNGTIVFTGSPSGMLAHTDEEDIGEAMLKVLGAGE